MRLIRARSHKMTPSTIECQPYRAPRPCSRERERKRERPPQKIIALLIHSFVLPNLGPSRINLCPSDTIGKVTIDEEEDETEKEKETEFEE